MMVTPNIKRASVKKFAQSVFAEGSTIRSDGYRSYIPALEGYTHEHKPYDPNSGLLHWLHIVISNAKAFILGTYHGLPKKNLQASIYERLGQSYYHNHQGMANRPSISTKWNRLPGQRKPACSLSEL